jgi:Fic family protein
MTGHALPHAKPISLDEVREQLRERLAQLEAEIAPLTAEAEEIRAMLGQQESQPTNTPSQQGDTRASFLSAVRDAPGKSGSDYAALVGTSKPTAVKHLKALVEAGELRREGEKRGTRWLPV